MKEKLRSVFVYTVMLGLLAMTIGFRATHASQEPTEAELVKRFSKVLAEKLDKKDVQITDEGKNTIEKIVTNAARAIVEKNTFNKLDDADAAFKRFADKLLQLGREPFRKTIDINGRTIDDALHGQLNPHGSDPTERKGGLCPLYPIC